MKAYISPSFLGHFHKNPQLKCLSQAQKNSLSLRRDFPLSTIPPLQDLGLRSGGFLTTAESMIMPIDLSMKRFGQVFTKLRKFEVSRLILHTG